MALNCTAGIIPSPLLYTQFQTHILSPKTLFHFLSGDHNKRKDMDTKQVSLLIWALFAFMLLLHHNMMMMVSCFEEDKTYYHSPPPTDPHNTRSPPSGHTPSHGGSPPANCGTPPTPHHDPTPTTPRPSTPHHNPTHAPPSTGYHYSPPPIPTITPSPPSVIYPPTEPGTPAISSPPYSVPTPPFSIPTPPFSISTPPFDPNSPPFTCDYWRNHPTLIWGVFGFWGSNLGSAFGTTTVPPLIGSHPVSVEDALSNTRNDGLGSLYRQGTASLLNSMVYTNFHYTPAQVRDHFLSSLSSDKAAASQARLFKLANEGRLNPRSL